MVDLILIRIFYVGLAIFLTKIYLYINFWEILIEELGNVYKLFIKLIGVGRGFDCLILRKYRKREKGRKNIAKEEECRKGGVVKYGKPTFRTV